MSVKQAEVVVRRQRNFLSIPLQSYHLRMFVKGNPDRKKNSLLLPRKQVQPNSLLFFRDFKPKNVFKGLMRLRLQVKILLMEIVLGVKVTRNIATTKNPYFEYL